jgi:hypothetical protein
LELREANHRHGDHHTLLVSAQRVSTLWHTVVRTSPALQRRLFLAADPDPQSQAHYRLLLQQNPLLLRAFPCLFSLDPNYSIYSGGNYWPSPRDQLPVGLGRDFRIAHAPQPTPSYEYWPARFSREWRQAMLRRGASWRRMFVSKPGVARVGRMGPRTGERPLGPLPGDRLDNYLSRAAAAGGGAGGGGSLRQRGGAWRREKTVVVGEPGGLRMGELYDVVFDACWPDPGCGENENGAWVAWRARKVLGWERYVRPGVGEGMGPGMSQPAAPDDERSAGFLEEADLVIGANSGSAWLPHCRWHGYSAGCFLNQSENKPMFRCEEYRRSGRLWLPWVESELESSDD